MSLTSLINFFIYLKNELEILLHIINNIKNMERRLNKKLETYITEFKDNIREKATQLGLNNEIKTTQLIQYIVDYDRLSFNKEDFQKRKRVKNFVPIYDRCCAKRSNAEQCTRRKKEGFEFCGTHTKGTPHGIVDSNLANIKNTYKVEVWAQDIKGIVYYIDKSGNVYDTTDIIMNKLNPKIIAKYTKIEDIYSIPEFNI